VGRHLLAACRRAAGELLSGGALLFAFPAAGRPPAHDGFAPIYRVFGLLCLLLPMLVLGHWGWGSYLADYEGVSTRTIEGGYEVAGFLASAWRSGSARGAVAGHGQYRHHLLRHLPVHQVLRLVVGC
jgi:hypothetical protein